MNLRMAFRRLFTRIALPRAAPLILASGIGLYALPQAAAEECEQPSFSLKAKSAERTFIAIKPDGVQVKSTISIRCQSKISFREVSLVKSLNDLSKKDSSWLL